MRIALLVLVAACAGPIAGQRLEHPRSPPPGPAVATARASDANGLRVLAHRNAGRGDRGLLATDADQLAALWDDVALGSRPPAIDFTTHVVLGTSFDDGVCHAEIVAAHVDAAGILTLEQAPLGSACILLLSRTSLVVAIPRAILPPRFIWRTGHGDFAFSLGPRAAIATSPAPIIDTGARSSIASPRGTIALPAVGHIALRSLDDGREVWVARRDADDISVVLADHATRTRGLHTTVRWNDKTHRFWSGHDSRGRSLHGGRPLDVLAFARVPEDRIAVGEPITVPYAPPVARADEPALDGPDAPYANATPTSFRAVADRRFGVIADSLVVGTRGTAQLCTLPEGKARRYLAGCLRSHPTVTTIAMSRSRGISMTMGPLAIRRAGSGADLVIDLGHGQAGWTVDQELLPAAPNGPPRRRGALAVGVTVTGSTSGGVNSSNPPDACVPIVGRGSPDESWTFTPPRAGTYVFELASSYDGTLVLLDDAAPISAPALGCNDDAKGHYRRSAIRVELAATTRVRVVVDGFGGARGTYKLTVHAHPTLERLAVGGAVTGDTTNAIDLEAHGCTADAGDHRYPLAIREAGRYAFRIDTPGWAPMLGVLRAGGSALGCYTHLSPLVDSHALEPGDYFVVIDGGRTKDRGPYTLRVERCPTEDAKACEAAVRASP